MATFHYTPPPEPTSVDAITITQTLTQLGGPITTTFVTLTTLTLSKPTPTSTPNSHHRDHSGLSPSAIGAIVGSILGSIVLIALIYYCCYSTRDEDSEAEDRPIPRHVEQTRQPRLDSDDSADFEDHPVAESEDYPVHQTPRQVGIRTQDDKEFALKVGTYDLVKGKDYALSRPRRRRRAPMNRAYSQHR